MLTVREPCDSEYRVRALLLGPRQGVTSLLIGDIRVPAAASYPQFRSLLLLLFNLFTLSSPSPLLLILSCSSSLRSALISSRQTKPFSSPHPYPPPPLSLPTSPILAPPHPLSITLPQHPSPTLVCISSGGTVRGTAPALTSGTVESGE